MNERYARRTIPFVVAATMATHVAAARPPATASMSTDCPPSSSRVLRLYVINHASASPQALDTAILETSAIWATAGLRLTWVFPPAPLDLTDNRTAVVMIERRLKRPPTLSAVPSKGPAMPLLGQVPFGEDGPGNLIEVSFGAITSLVMGSSFLDKPVAKLPDFLQQVLLGRGLGRVLAHELGHWLVGRGHMQEGLMRPAFGDRDLVEWNSPRLPRAWTASGAGVLMARFSRCEPTIEYDHLIIALESITNFYHLQGLETNALTM
jgi:hypothetical protein